MKSRLARMAGKAGSYIILSAIGLTVIFPFYILLIESLHPNIVTLPYPVEILPSRMSFANYAYLFQNYPIVTWIFNSLVIAVGSSVLQAILCAMAAYGFGRTEFRFRKQLYWLLMLLLVIPIQTRILPLFLVMSKLKWINTFMAWIPFASDAFGIYLLRQFMVAIPADFDEAAHIDGATPMTVFRKIILPQTKPALVVLITFNFITQWNDFLYPLIMVRDDRMLTLQLGLANIFSSAMRGEGGGIGVALAGAVISFLPTLFIYMAFQNKVVEGMNYSTGVKG